MKGFVFKSNLTLGERKYIQGNNLRNTASETVKHVSPLGEFSECFWSVLLNDAWEQRKEGMYVCL